MNTLSKTFAAVLVLTVAGASGIVASSAAPAARQTAQGQNAQNAAAIRACSQINQYQPVRVNRTVPDGRGNVIVWLNDADRDLWMCNADNAGNVYANDIMAGDMLNGEGSNRLLRQNVVASEDDFAQLEPRAVAENICRISAPQQPAQVVSTASDGMDDFNVFVRNASNQLYLCNASGRAEIFSLVRADRPLRRAPSRRTPSA